MNALRDLVDRWETVVTLSFTLVLIVVAIASARIARAAIRLQLEQQAKRAAFDFRVRLLEVHEDLGRPVGFDNRVQEVHQAWFKLFSERKLELHAVPRLEERLHIFTIWLEKAANVAHRTGSVWEYWLRMHLMHEVVQLAQDLEHFWRHGTLGVVRWRNVRRRYVPTQDELAKLDYEEPETVIAFNRKLRKKFGASFAPDDEMEAGP